MRLTRSRTLIASAAVALTAGAAIAPAAIADDSVLDHAGCSSRPVGVDTLTGDGFVIGTVCIDGEPVGTVFGAGNEDGVGGVVFLGSRVGAAAGVGRDGGAALFGIDGAGGGVILSRTRVAAGLSPRFGSGIGGAVDGSGVRYSARCEDASASGTVGFPSEDDDPTQLEFVPAQPELNGDPLNTGCEDVILERVPASAE